MANLSNIQSSWFLKKRREKWEKKIQWELCWYVTLQHSGSDQLRVALFNSASKRSISVWMIFACGCCFILSDPRAGLICWVRTNNLRKGACFLSSLAETGNGTKRGPSHVGTLNENLLLQITTVKLGGATIYVVALNLIEIQSRGLSNYLTIKA